MKIYLSIHCHSLIEIPWRVEVYSHSCFSGMQYYYYSVRLRSCVEFIRLLYSHLGPIVFYLLKGILSRYGSQDRPRGSFSNSSHASVTVLFSKSFLRWPVYWRLQDFISLLIFIAQILTAPKIFLCILHSEAFSRYSFAFVIVSRKSPWFLS